MARTRTTPPPRRQAPWGRGPDALDPPLDTRQVVYAGDVGGQRWARVVGVVDEQLTGVWLRGPVGAPGDTLTLGDEPKPVFDPEIYSFYSEGTTVVFVLGRPGDRVSVSERSDIDAAGTVSRDYRAVDTVDGVAAVELSPRWLSGLSIQVDRGSETVFRGGGNGSAEFGPDDQSPTWTDPQISAAASAVLGTAPNHEIARLVLEHLTDDAGFAVDERQLSVLWAGPIGDPDLSDAHAVLISAVLPSGAVAVLGGSGQLNDDAQVTTGGIQLLRLYPAGTATQDLLLVMRCDLYDGSGPTPFDSALVILGPAGTASFRLAGAAPTDVTSQDGRVLIVHPGDGVTSVQALDAGGAVLADETVGGVADVTDRGEGPIN